MGNCRKGSRLLKEGVRTSNEGWNSVWKGFIVYITSFTWILPNIFTLSKEVWVKGYIYKIIWETGVWLVYSSLLLSVLKGSLVFLSLVYILQWIAITSPDRWVWTEGSGVTIPKGGDSYPLPLYPKHPLPTVWPLF